MARLNSFYEILLMISFVPFLVYFMLSWRDHINRSFLQFFHGEDRLIAARSLQGIADMVRAFVRSEEHTSELQSLRHLVCRLLLEKKKKNSLLALPL